MGWKVAGERCRGALRCAWGLGARRDGAEAGWKRMMQIGVNGERCRRRVWKVKEV